MANVFKQIQPLLVEAIPQRLSKLAVTSPICILRISYYDTHAPDATIQFRFVTEQHRKDVIQRRKAEYRFYLWDTGEECGEHSRLTIPGTKAVDALDKKLVPYLKQVYHLLCDEDREDEFMGAWAAVIQNAAKSLNKLDWPVSFQVTDDFVVAAADGSRFFCNEEADLLESIPANKLKLLQQRGHLGPDEALLAPLS